MKKSFITKIFSGVIALLFFVFMIQFIFQTYIFPIYFLNQVENNIEKNLFEISKIEKSQFYSKLNDFTEKTQTISTILNSTDLTDNRLNEITVSSDNNIYKINIPMIYKNKIEINDEITGQFIKTNRDTYLPVSLFVNDKKVYGGMMKRRAYEFDYKDEVTIEGKVTDINSTISIQKEDIIFSQEIVNLQTGNVSDFTRTPIGVNYISKNINGENNNLVYVTNINSPDGDLLLTVYSLSNISIISKSLSLFNTLTYITAFIVLIILSTIYIKKISVPLVKINETTKKLSNLDFTNIEEFDREDEIGELSKSINILSTNLKTALKDLEERNAQLSNAYDRELERDKLRKDFVQSISHELKTPLSIIQASSEALSLNMFDSQKEINKQYETISREITRSNKLIMDMINVYKIDQIEYKTNWIEFDLKDTIIKINNSLSKLAETKNIDVELNMESFIIMGDTNKMELVISNLYSNAIKYTNNNEKIIINLSKDKLEIINTGTKIPEESINNLFEPFYRVDKAKSRKEGSTGLGLYIVKQILDQHELKYKIENIEKGVKFSIER